MTFDRPLSAAALREIRPVASPPRRFPITVVTLVAAAALAIGIGAGKLLWGASPASFTSPIAARPRGFVLPPSRLTNQGGVARPIELPAMRDPTASMFVEREGNEETPRITVTNGDRDTIHVLLKDPAGRISQLTVAGHATVSISVPADRYDVAVTSENQTIRPNYGDAVFRTRKQYFTTLIQSSNHSPLHLGD